MATHSSILPGESSRTEEPGGLYSSWGLKESDITEQLSTIRFLDLSNDKTRSVLKMLFFFFWSMDEIAKEFTGYHSHRYNNYILQI